MNTATGEISVETNGWDVYDPEITVDTETGEITYDPEYDDWYESVDPAGLLDSYAVAGDTVVGKWPMVGPTPGQTEHYTIEPIVIENRGTITAPFWQFVANWIEPTTSQRVTSIVPPPGPPTENWTIITNQQVVSASLYNSCLLYTSPSPRDRS